MLPEPSEKRTRVLSSEEDSQFGVLAEDAMLLIEDIQTKLEKLKVLDKINKQLSKIEYDIKYIKANVAKLEEGLNYVNSDVAKIKQDLEKKVEKEKLEELENKVEELRNRSRQNNLVFYNVLEKAQGQDCAEFIQDFIATNMGLETLCGHVEIEFAHRTPTRRAQNSDKKKPRPIHVAFLRYTDKAKILSNAAARLKDNPFQGNLISIGADYEKKTQEQQKELVPYKKTSTEEDRAGKKVFIAYDTTLKYLDENGEENIAQNEEFKRMKSKMKKKIRGKRSL